MNLYVGTYAKYNAGSLRGAWLDLDDYTDREEFLAACRELHKDERDPELMFQDFEATHEWDGREFYSESGAPAAYWEIRGELERLGVSDEVFAAWVAITTEPLDGDAVRKCAEQYCEEMSGEEYAEQLAEDCGYLPADLPSLISSHIDWAGVWRDLTFDGYEESDGFIFDTNK